MFNISTVTITTRVDKSLLTLQSAQDEVLAFQYFLNRRYMLSHKGKNGARIQAIIWIVGETVLNWIIVSSRTTLEKQTERQF